MDRDRRGGGGEGKRGGKINEVYLQELTPIKFFLGEDWTGEC